MLQVLLLPLIGQSPDLPLLTYGVGQRLYPFTVRGSDGRKYDLRSLTKRGPVLLVVLYHDLEHPHVSASFKDLNRLDRAMAGKVRVVGIVRGGPEEMRRIQRRQGARFLLVGDERRLSAMLLATDLAHASGLLKDLTNALLLPSGKVTHIWRGYNQSSLRAMQADARQWAGKRLSLDFTKFPTKLRLGEGAMYGLPPP